MTEECFNQPFLCCFGGDINLPSKKYICKNEDKLTLTASVHILEPFHGYWRISTSNPNTFSNMESSATSNLHIFHISKESSSTNWHHHKVSFSQCHPFRQLCGTVQWTTLSLTPAVVLWDLCYKSCHNK